MLVDSTAQNVLYVTGNFISYYDFSIVDTSQIEALDFGQTFADYKTDVVQNTYLIDYQRLKSTVFVSQIVQSRKYSTVVWSINSLDLILGLVGGFTAMIWATLAFCISNYEDFSFQQSLIGSVNPTSP